MCLIIILIQIFVLNFFNLLMKIIVIKQMINTFVKSN